MSLRCNAAAAVMSLALASSMPASDAAAGDGFGNQNVFSASPTVNWTGVSIGAHGGWVDGDVDFPDTPAYPDGPPRPDLSGGLIGGLVGAAYQFGSFVLGATADLSGMDLKDTVRDGNYLNETAEIDQLITVRGVFGLALGRFLPYATVGWAWGDLTYGAECADAAAVPFGGCGKPGPRSYSDDVSVDGIAYGLGLKYAIDDHWSVGAEYLRIDFDNANYTNGPLAAWPASVRPITSDLDVARFTVDWRF